MSRPSPLANGGAFGGKRSVPVRPVARRLADEHGRAVRVLLSREDTVRLGPKRPPIAAGVRADGTGVVRVVRTPGIAEAIGSVAPGLVVEEVDVAGPPTSMALRAAGWAEAAVLCCWPRWRRRLRRRSHRRAGRGRGRGGIDAAGASLGCGAATRSTRSCCARTASAPPTWRSAGCASEGIAVDDDGAVHDLTIRSFGILRAATCRRSTSTIEPGDGAAGQRLRRRVRRGGRRRLDGRTAPDARLATRAGMTVPAKPVGPYTPIVRAGDWLVVSGQVGLGDGGLVDGGVQAQLRQALANLAALLEGEGASLADVVKTTVFLTNIDDYAAMNEAYVEAFGDHRPARSAIGVAALPLGALVEVEAWARVGDGMMRRCHPHRDRRVIIVLVRAPMPVVFMLGGIVSARLGWALKRRRRGHDPRGRPRLIDLRTPVEGYSAPAGLAEAVADRAHGLDEVGVLLAELGPQAPDVDVDGAGAAVVLVAPHPRQQRLAGEHLARVGGEELQQLVLHVGEVERLARRSRPGRSRG